MNFKLYIQLLIIGILISFSLSSYADNEKSIIYNAYINNDMGVWKKTIDNMNAQKNKTIEREFELLNYEYGYIGFCIGMKKKEEASIYIARGESRINKLMKNKANLGLVHAYKAAFYGFQIGMNKVKAPFLGPKSIEEAKTSIELDKNNYFGYMQFGNIEYYMPAIFGGSKQKALEYYLKSKTIMDKNNLKQDWIYLNLVVLIAQTYQELNNWNYADAYYKLALKLAPDFQWVSKELYPKFLKTKKQNE
ncbi:MAG: hypothetical protein WC135_01185 [Bacteroidales bacterium]